MDTTPPIYHETQRFRQSWLWVLVVAPAALAWWAFIDQVLRGHPMGQNPAPDWLIWVIWVFVGIGLPVFFGSICLITEITADAVRIHYRPLTRRVIPLAEIERVEARKYNPVKEYGGWGVKGWSKAKMAYNVSGDRGVELTLTGGRSVMVGSQRAAELAAAIDNGRRAQPRRPA